eukprot:4886-Heterococcus_DN1.PRE.2
MPQVRVCRELSTYASAFTPSELYTTVILLCTKLERFGKDGMYRNTVAATTRNVNTQNEQNRAMQ